MKMLWHQFLKNSRVVLGLMLAGSVNAQTTETDDAWHGAEWIGCQRNLQLPMLAPPEYLGAWITTNTESITAYRGRFELPPTPVVRAMAWWESQPRTESTLVLNGDDHFYDSLIRRPRRAMDLAFMLKSGKNLIEVRFLKPLTKAPTRFGMRVQFADGSEQIIKSDQTWVALNSDGGELALSQADATQPTDSPLVAFPQKRLAPAWFRTSFTVKPGLKKATLRHCGLGYGDSFVNGSRVSDRVLSPPQTDYEAFTMFEEDDVTPLLQPGANVFAMQLASGWYHQVGGFGVILSYGRPRLRVALRLDYQDGTTEWCTSNAHWEYKEGAWQEANIYSGEIVDYRLSHDEWKVVGTDEKGWTAAKVQPSPTAVMRPRDFPAMRGVREIAPQSITPVGSKTWLVDFGENIAGWIRLPLTTAEKSGQEIIVRYTEAARDGVLQNVPESHWWCHGEPQRDILICDGGARLHESRFTYKGFRFVEISGLAQKPDPTTLRAIVVNTDCKTTADFHSSDPLLNRIWEMGVRTHLANMHSILEDCPHREKCQWGGDLHGSWAMGFHALDSAEFYRQQVRLFYTGPMAPGQIPGLVGVGKRLTTLQMDFNWGISPLFLSYRLWTHKGDLETAREFMPSMRHYLNWFDLHGNNGFPHMHRHADHASPEKDIPRNPQDKELISAINYFAGAQRFAALAGALEMPDDVARGQALATKIRTAILTRYDAEKHTFGNGTHDSLALAMGIFSGDPEEEQRLASSLVGYYRANGFKFDGGFMSYWIYPILTRYGYTDDAYRMLTNADYPGVAWSIKKWDATSFWEKFTFDERKQFERSLSHHATNHPAAWLLTDLAGIRLNLAKPGGRHLILAPSFPSNLTETKGSFQTIDGGKVTSSWRRNDQKIIWDVTLTGEAHATLAPHGYRAAKGKLPAEITAGTYRFELVAE